MYVCVCVCVCVFVNVCVCVCVCACLLVPVHAFFACALCCARNDTGFVRRTLSNTFCSGFRCGRARAACARV